MNYLPRTESVTAVRTSPEPCCPGLARGRCKAGCPGADRDPFQVWMKKVNSILIRKAGLDADSCEDHCWRDLFDDGLSPTDAADDALDCWGLLW